MNIESVFTKSTAAQPGSPSLGSRYLVPVAATGADWAGEDGKVAIYTAAGWRFATLPVGKLLYVEDEEAYYHRNTLGTWVAGVGSLAFGNKSIPITSVIGASASFVIKVENQTTNAPPGSPTAGVAYIIGPSPTGSWAGNAGKLAICITSGAYTIVAPVRGDEVFDKSLNVMTAFNGSGWAASAGIWIGGARVSSQGGPTIAPTGTAPYTYSDATGPTTSTPRLVDAVTLAYAAKRSGSILRFHYTADAVYIAAADGPGTNGDMVIGLYRDAETNSIDWQKVSAVGELVTAGAQQVRLRIDHWFEVTAPSTASFTYTIGMTSRYTDLTHATHANTVKRRLFEVEELA